MGQFLILSNPTLAKSIPDTNSKPRWAVCEAQNVYQEITN